ncbi:MAG: imidazole glycerol phosphate synthase subunit HisH [Clostridia bacterium]|nr:imidazole glycerol phosphate synthase subunit HisH [Clostridia bacterium]
MIAIIDYGVGNLYSLSHSLSHIGAENIITRNPSEIEHADKLILPGVGAFGDAKKKLDDTGLTSLIIRLAKEGKPLLGICLGMQMLFDKSFEYGEHEGLHLIPGEIRPIEPDLSVPLKVPHIGWNTLHITRPCLLTKYISEGDSVYYVHSYYAKNIGSALSASSEYDVAIPGVVTNGNVFGTQFHPEKSGEIGLRILKAFAE